MVPIIITEAGQSTTTHTSLSRGDPSSLPQPPSRHHTLTAVWAISGRDTRVANFQKQPTFRSSQLSEAATDLVLSSWREKLSKSYDSCFWRWASWYGEWDRDPVCESVSDVANFLTGLYQEGYQYRSLNSYRSSISSTHEHADRHPVDQHPTIVRFMKGAFNKRPPNLNIPSPGMCLKLPHILLTWGRTALSP